MCSCQTTSLWVESGCGMWGLVVPRAVWLHFGECWVRWTFVRSEWLFTHGAKGVVKDSVNWITVKINMGILTALVNYSVWGVVEISCTFRCSTLCGILSVVCLLDVWSQPELGCLVNCLVGGWGGRTRVKCISSLYDVWSVMSGVLVKERRPGHGYCSNHTGWCQWPVMSW